MKRNKKNFMTVLLIFTMLITQIPFFPKATVVMASPLAALHSQLPDFQEEVKNILSFIKPEMSDVEKALAVHEYFLSNYSYGYSYIRSYPSGELAATGDSYTAYGIMTDRIGVCEAFAQAYKYVMDKIGIPCIIVSSNAMDHAWNMVCIDDEWYHVDVTWDDTDDPGNARHMNFLRSDEGIAQTGHFGWDSSVTASSTKYDDAFWINIYSYICYIDGEWFYVDSGDISFEYYYDGSPIITYLINYSNTYDDGLIKKYNFRTDTHETVFTVPPQSYTYNNRGRSIKTTWKGSGTTIAAYDGKIYYNTNNAIYSLKPDGSNNSLICTVTLADAPASFDEGRGYITGIDIHNGRIYYKNSEDGMDYLAAALPGAVPVFTITVSTEQNGYIIPGACITSEGSVEVLKNRSRTFRIAPYDGFYIKDVLVDGVSVGAVSLYTFENVNKNHSIHVTFGVEGVNTPEGEWELVMLDEEYDDIYFFSEGLAVVLKDSQYGYIDSSGKLVIPLSDKYEGMYNFQNGLASVYKGGKYGCINKSGILIIPCIYDIIGAFTDGMAEVMKNGKYGFINIYGEEVVPCIYENIRGFRNGIAWVFKDGKGSYIDTNGNEVPGPEDGLEYFENDYYHEKDLTYVYKDGKYGFQKISTGEIVIPYIYDYAYEFSEGLAVVCRDGKYGYINTEGKVVIPFEYDYAGNFSEGLAYVQNGLRYGYINKSGEVVVPFTYDSARNFSDNKAVVTINDKWAILKRISQDNAGKTTSDNPSNWAMDEINTAIALDLIPYDMQNNYTANITRAEFCKLIINMLTVKTRQSVNEILSEKGITINRSVFSDTSDTAILAANALGIVMGVGNNKFNPNGTITRQEAAVMLHRAAKVLGVTSPNGTALEFSDASKFPDWSAESIIFISSMIDKTTNKRVMGGTGGNKFSNLDSYTREQSYLTVLRLFKAIR